MYAAHRARLHPDRPALVMAGSGRQLTFAEYEDRCNRLARVFLDAGLRPGDHVAFLLENSLAAYVAQGAAERCGLYHTPVNFHLTAPEAAYIVDDSTARAVIVSATFDGLADRLPATCPRVQRWWVLDPSLGNHAAPVPQHFSDLHPLMAAASGDPLPDEVRRLGGPMLYSSGTTGRPKGVLRPVPDAAPDTAGEFWETAARVAYRMREDMVFLQPGPNYHSGPQASTSCALRLGGTTVVLERFEAQAMLAAVDAHRVTHLMAVPTMLARAVQLPVDVRDRYEVSSLEAVVHVAAPCPPGVKRALIEWLGPILYENYGSTEANGGTTCTSQEWLERPGTVGRAALGEVRILDDTGAPVPPGTVGEVWFAGATNFEYFGGAATTDGRSADGTMSTTGDLGYLDDDGYLFLTDRKNFTIISGGVNIYPREVEDALMEHPAVADAAVFGIPHPDMGEQVRAVVELLPGTAVGETELDTHCRTLLARFKCPRSYDFVGHLPRSAAGKVDKAALRAPFLPAVSA
ncbi:AMP-binding protein [Nakamurella sp. YIM 132087]|uniref:AMP-binding protein n=1 Tax=Nakamurella alba TaxID=2665158 RepID=A0A7K1FJC7_9ACTN|nr:AMP-binding protein [Nakamurella alba]MTD14198.1 AMP-binding protein [Nakamurella alba]